MSLATAILLGRDASGTWSRSISRTLAARSGYPKTNSAYVAGRQLLKLSWRCWKANLALVADLDLYNRLSGNLRRILDSLGLERRGRNITPDSDVVAHFKRRPRKVDAE
jgi:hypothetical protein